VGAAVALDDTLAGWVVIAFQDLVTGTAGKFMESAFAIYFGFTIVVNYIARKYSVVADERAAICGKGDKRENEGRSCCHETGLVKRSVTFVTG
jgi:Zn-dependent protease with chaperone function